MKGKSKAVAIFEVKVPAPLATSRGTDDMKAAAFVLRRCRRGARRRRTRSSAASEDQQGASKAKETKQKVDDMNFTDAEERQLGETGQRQAASATSASIRTRTSRNT